MKYMVSYNRIAKNILPIILKDRTENQYYVEPFCGGCNLIDKVEGNRIASDNNEYVIAFFKKLQTGWLPEPNITQEQYNYIKQNQDLYPKYLIGYVATQLSYGALWFSAYRKDKIGKRNYSQEAFNNVLKQQINIKNILFYFCSFDKLIIPPNSIIYCDPPYKNTASYITSKNFDYDKFYQWCRNMKKQGHTIFISEYNMPDDFTCVWQKEITSSLTQNTGSKKAIEKLFTIKERQ